MATANRKVLPGFSLTLGYTVTYLGLLVILPIAACFAKAFSLSWADFWNAVWTDRAKAAYALTFGTSFVAAIVNVASVAGLLPGISSSAYAAAKGGQILFSKALAAELAPDVRVNALVVGPTETPLTEPNFRAMHDSGAYEDFIRLFPLGRVAKPGEIANVAAMLLSDQASFVTGAAWTVDGGRSLH